MCALPFVQTSNTRMRSWTSWCARCSRGTDRAEVGDSCVGVRCRRLRRWSTPTDWGHFTTTSCPTCARGPSPSSLTALTYLSCRGLARTPSKRIRSLKVCASLHMFTAGLVSVLCARLCMRASMAMNAIVNVTVSVNVTNTSVGVGVNVTVWMLFGTRIALQTFPDLRLKRPADLQRQQRGARQRSRRRQWACPPPSIAPLTGNPALQGRGPPPQPL